MVNNPEISTANCSLFNEQQTGKEIELKRLSKELPALLKAQNFPEFTQQNSYQLVKNFPPDCRTLKYLTKYSGSGSLTINFDALLLNERVFFRIL
ncbi:MAG: nucleoid-associated protein [Arsenophonus sp. NEOnobi-MAG3]